MATSDTGIRDVRVTEEIEIYDEVEQLIEPPADGYRLHFREDCPDVDHSNRRVDTACYPRGYRRLCKKCTDRWRDE